MKRALSTLIGICWLAGCGGGGSSNPSMLSAAPTITFSADPATVAYQAGATLTWTATNATSCTASGDWSGSEDTSGSKSLDDLTSDTTYTLSCSGTGGSANKTVTVTVGPAVSFTANPTTVNYNGDSTLSWSSHNATTCTASGNWSGNEATSGSQKLTHLKADATYTLTCTGSGGSTAQTATITVGASPPAAPPTIAFSAAPTSVSYGGISQLTWNARNATSCSGTGSWASPEPTSGTLATASLTSTAEYDLTCTGPGGTTSKSVTVAVVPVGNLNLGGVWTVSPGTGAPAGINSGFLVTSPTGPFFYITYANNCTGLYYGNLSISGSSPYTVTGNGSFAPDPWSADVAGCFISQGDTFSGTLTPGGTLQLASLGTATFDWGFDASWYNQPSAISSIAGSWSQPVLGQTVTLTVNADGSVYMQSPLDNCVLQGQAQIINAGLNVYSFSFTYSSCTGADSALNGRSGTGLITLDTGTSPLNLVMGLDVPMPSGPAYLLSGIFTKD